MGQPPGHTPLQQGVLPIGRGSPPEAFPHPGREGGLWPWQGQRVNQRLAIHALRSVSSGVLSRQWPASG
jgi:hypothetical protein